MQTNEKTTKSRLFRMVGIALFCALAYVAMLLIHFPVSFLTLDPKDAIITLCGLCFGPISALVSSLVVALLEMVTVSSTGPYGLLMNFVSSASFILPAAILFRVRRTRFSAMVGLGLSVVVMVGVMLPMNLLITPLYQNVPRSVVADMIPGTLLPFNIIKAIMNAALTALLFQPVRRALNGVKILPPDEERRRVPAWVLPVVAGAVAVAAVLIFFLVLDGKFSLFR